MQCSMDDPGSSFLVSRGYAGEPVLGESKGGDDKDRTTGREKRNQAATTQLDEKDHVERKSLQLMGVVAAKDAVPLAIVMLIILIDEENEAT